MRKHKKPGPVTTLDIARASGVSTATVSYVLSGRSGVRISQETRDRVLEQARRMQYRPNGLATALRKGRTNTIGIVTPYAIVGRPSSSRLVYGKDLMLALTFAAARQGMSVMFYVDAPESPLTPESVMDRRVDGVILSGQYGVREWVESVTGSGLPCVEIGSAHGRWHVHPDNQLGVRQAVDHLLALGHRRIALWTGPDSALAARERAETFYSVMKEAGYSKEDLPTGACLEEIERLFTAEERPTALFTYNDSRAVDALHLFKRIGIRVPEDVSVIGFDNDIRATSAIPALTTVQNPVSEMADAAIRLLINQIEGVELEGQSLRIPTNLIVRESTSSPFPTR